MASTDEKFVGTRIVIVVDQPIHKRIWIAIRCYKKALRHRFGNRNIRDIQGCAGVPCGKDFERLQTTVPGINKVSDGCTFLCIPWCLSENNEAIETITFLQRLIFHKEGSANERSAYVMRRVGPPRSPGR
jgi:hypothetical protein